MMTMHVHLSASTHLAMHQGDHGQWLSIADPHGNEVVLFASDTQLIALVCAITNVLLHKGGTTPQPGADSAPAVAEHSVAVGTAQLADDGRPGTHV